MDQAINIAQCFLAKSGISHRIISEGVRIKTTHVQLLDNSGIISLGSGKGLGQQSLASAIFEAVEHLLYTKLENGQDTVFRKLDLDDSDALLRSISPSFGRISGKEQLQLTRTPMAELLGGRSIGYPTFLLYPDFCPSSKEEADDISKYRLSRYSSNSGTAAGLSKEEAQLHAILEVIERDALGVLFLQTVIRHDALPVRRVVQNSLSKKLESILYDIERETKGTVSIYDVTTDVGVPASLAKISVSDGEKAGNYFGSGASLCSEYSIERAALEALQTFHIYEISKFKRPRRWSIPDEQLPLYLRCNLEAGIFSPRAGYVDTCMNYSWAENQSCLDVSEQVRVIASKLKAMNFPVFSKTIANHPIWVVRVEVLGLEKFHLISHGAPVIPNQRGRSIISEVL